MDLPTPDALQIALTLSTLVVIWVGWAKFLGPRVKAKWDWFVGILQSIGGRDPIVDKRTGVEIAPMVPALGVQLLSIDKRFETVNENMAQLIEVVKSNQDAHHRIDSVEQRVTVLETAEDARREVRAESTAMWQAVANKDVIDAEEL